MDARALIPRPETEELAAHLGRRLEATPPTRILDLGTGSGALALALAQSFSAAVVTATDASKEALELARENAQGNGLAERISFLEGSWWEALPEDEPYDLIVSNPLTSLKQRWKPLFPEVTAYEPHAALVAGADLRDLRILLAGAALHLVKGGLLALEANIAQGDALLALAQEHGLQGTILEDLNQRPRFFAQLAN